MPNRLGKDQYKALIVPIIITFIYYSILYLQTFIKETNDEDAIGYTYYFKGYLSFGFFSVTPLTFNLFIVAFLAIWIAIRIINLNGSIGNVAISAIVFGFIYFLLDLLLFITFLIEMTKRAGDDSSAIDVISQERELLVSNFLYNLLEFTVLCVVFAGIYFEIVKYFKPNKDELYPTA